jgi:hypothetical protein
MSNLESTRPGWFVRAFGIVWILLAIGLTVWDLREPHLPTWIASINVISFVSGVVNFHLGTIRIRRAREHHEFMERHREFMETHRGLPGGAS